MLTDVSVSISGPVLAFLLYENANSKTDQEGFLIGEVVNQVIGSISDSQISGEKVRTIIKIYSVLPCPKCHAFYNGVGKVDSNELSRILGDQPNDVVGFYRFCQNLSPKQFLRDRVLHKEIAKAVKETTSELFLTCRLGLTVNKERSTHGTELSFFRFTNRGFEPVGVNIPNLGNTSHTEYKTAEEGSVEDSSNDFLPLVNALKISDESYPEAVTTIQKTYQRYLKNLVVKLDTSEQKLADTRQMLCRLEDEIREIEKVKEESLVEIKIEEKMVSESGDDRLNASSVKMEGLDDQDKSEDMEVVSSEKGSPTESADRSNSSQDLFDLDGFLQPTPLDDECKPSSNIIGKPTSGEKSPVVNARRLRQKKGSS